MNRLKIAVALALIAIPPALGTAYLVARPNDQGDAEDSRFVTVLVATRDFPKGAVIKEPQKYFQEKKIRSSAAPQGSFHQLDRIDHLELAKPITKGECITERHDYRSLSLDEQVQERYPGHIGVTVQVEVDGNYLPMDRVDLYGKQVRDTDKHTLIEENLLIWSVDVEAVAGKLSENVTFVVLPDQAAKLRAEAEHCELRIVLRRWIPD
jgi:Flp pilus assembly protein CpaB